MYSKYDVVLCHVVRNLHFHIRSAAPVLFHWAYTGTIDVDNKISLQIVATSRADGIDETLGIVIDGLIGLLYMGLIKLV